MNRGFIRISSDEMHEDEYNIIKNAAELCDELVVGIPNEWVYARLFGSEMTYNAENVRDMWLSFPFVSDVVILGVEELSLKDTYAKVSFDTYFYGSEYGRALKKDKEFANMHNIEMVSLVSQNGDITNRSLAGLDQALLNVRPNWKIVIYGANERCLRYLEKYTDKYVPEYIVDDDSSKWNSSIKNTKICDPDILLTEDSQKLLVVICQDNYKDIVDKLNCMGDFDYRTNNFVATVALMDELSILIDGEKKYISDCQETLRGILKEFDTICRDNDINYYMMCGSLIGVLRNQGFIPWDDDLDVAMTREDFERFRKIFNEKWGNNKKYRLRDVYDWGFKSFADMMPRIVDMEKEYDAKINTTVSDGSDQELFVYKAMDIYILDSAYDNNAKHNLQMSMLKFIYNLAMGHRYHMDYKQYDRIGKMYVFLMMVLNKLGRLLPLKMLIRWYHRVCQWGNRKSDGDSYFIGGMSITYVGRRFGKKMFGKAKNMCCDDIEVMVPEDYDGLLDEMGYGSYMVEPPYSFRMPSHYFGSEIEIW